MEMLIGLNIKSIAHPTLGRVVCEIGMAAKGGNYLSLSIGSGVGQESFEQSSRSCQEFLESLPEKEDQKLMCWGHYEKELLDFHIEEFARRGRLPRSFVHYLRTDGVRLVNFRDMFEEFIGSKVGPIEEALGFLSEPIFQLYPPTKTSLIRAGLLLGMSDQIRSNCRAQEWDNLLTKHLIQ